MEHHKMECNHKTSVCTEQKEGCLECKRLACFTLSISTGSGVSSKRWNITELPPNSHCTMQYLQSNPEHLTIWKQKAMLVGFLSVLPQQPFHYKLNKASRCSTISSCNRDGRRKHCNKSLYLESSQTAFTEAWNRFYNLMISGLFPFPSSLQLIQCMHTGFNGILFFP